MPGMASSTIRSGRVARTLRALVFDETARISGVAAINLLFFFTAGKADLGGVDHDHVIARIEKRRVAGLMLAHQEHGSLTGHAAQHLVLRIDQVPLAHNFPLGRGIGFSCRQTFSVRVLQTTQLTNVLRGVSNQSDVATWRRRSPFVVCVVLWGWQATQSDGLPPTGT